MPCPTPMPSSSSPLIERRRLFSRLHQPHPVLIAAGHGLGTTTLLEHALPALTRWERHPILIPASDPSQIQDLYTFLRRFLPTVMRATGQRLFEGEGSAYASAETSNPQALADLVAQDLRRLRTRGTTLLIDSLHPDPSLATFLARLIHYDSPLNDAPHLHYIIAGPETLPTLLFLDTSPDLTILTSTDLAFTPDEARTFGLTTAQYKQCSGIPLLAQALLTAPSNPTLLQDTISSYIQGFDHALQPAVLLDSWGNTTLPALLSALDLPSDYLNLYHQRRWPFAYPYIPVPLLANTLRDMLAEREVLQHYTRRLATYYDAPDPLRALALRNTLPDASSAESHHRQQQLETWRQQHEWTNIRALLEPSIQQDATGLHIDLDATELLLLVQAIAHTPQHLEDLRLALNLLTLSEQEHLLPQPELGILRGHLLYRLGRLDAARDTYKDLWGTLSPHHPQRLEVSAQLAICLLETGSPREALSVLGDLPNHTQDLRVLTVHLQIRLAIGEVQRTHQLAHDLYTTYAPWPDSSSDATCRFIAVLVDLGSLEQALALLQQLPIGQAESPWLLVEYTRLRSVYEFRNRNYPLAYAQATTAARDATQLSRFSQLAGADYRDVSTQGRTLIWCFLLAIAQGDHPAANRHFQQLATLAIAESVLDRETQRCKTILDACLDATAQPTNKTLLGYDASELTYVLSRCFDEQQPDHRHPRALIDSWQSWGFDVPSSLPETPDPEAVVRTLSLNILRGAYTARYRNRSLKLNIREFELLYLLATGPQHAKAIAHTLYPDYQDEKAALDYLNVTLSKLRNELGEPRSDPGGLLQYDRSTQIRSLHPKVIIEVDLLELQRLDGVQHLPTAYLRPPPLAKKTFLLTPTYIREQVARKLLGADYAGSGIDAIAARLQAEDPEFLSVFHACRTDQFGSPDSR